mgnify:CR=1 FL=1
MITRYRSAALAVRNSLMLLVEHEDPSTKVRFWSVPGGGIEIGESEEQTAVRETLEETGYRVTLVQESKIQTRYFFKWNNEVYDCHTTWFLAETKDDIGQPVNDESYLLRHGWLHINEREHLFQSNASILNTVNSLLKWY